MNENYQFFLNQKIPPRDRKRCFYRMTRNVLLDKTPKPCSKCGVLLDAAASTVDHIIPDVIIRASFGKLHQSVANMRIMCDKCNQDDMISMNIGVLFNSNNIKSIKHSARFICDLVRKNEKNTTR